LEFPWGGRRPEKAKRHSATSKKNGRKQKVVKKTSLKIVHEARVWICCLFKKNWLYLNQKESRRTCLREFDGRGGGKPKEDKASLTRAYWRMEDVLEKKKLQLK